MTLKMISLAALIGGGVFLAFFKRHSLDDYKDTTPKADIKTYFNGPIKAWGVVQDWRGRVVERFEADMVGHWEGDVGTLKEHFAYASGKTQERIWKLQKRAHNSYEGTASDILGKAIGQTEGSAIHWSYVMDLPVGTGTYRITFDDWMWQITDRVIINRSYLKKFGLPVAQLTLFMQKQKP